MPYTCHQITHDSPQYHAAVALRHQVLRAPLGLHYTAAQLAAEATDYHFIVLNHKNTIVATAILSPRTNNTLQMRQVATLPTLQNQGIGTLLLQFTENFAKNHQYTTIILHARQHAIPFYTKNNYTPTGDTFIEVTLTHQKMIKNI